MKHLRNGKTLLVVLSLSLSACRTTRPPSISNCIGDGLGGCDGYDRTGKEIHKAPSELQNWIMFPQPEFAEFAGWCYNIKPEQVREMLEQAQKSTDAALLLRKAAFAPEPKKEKDK